MQARLRHDVISKAAKQGIFEKIGGGHWALPEFHNDRKDKGGA